MTWALLGDRGRRYARIARIVPGAIGLMFLTACGQDAATTAPTSSVPENKLETFTGSVAPGGNSSHVFTVASPSPVFVTLTQVGPSSVAMGIGIGLSSGSTCSLLPGASQNTSAGSVVQLSGLVTPGTFCVQIFDVGNQSETVTYTVTVSHN